jgi:hypothetical protein
MAGDVEAFHLGLADLDAVAIGARVEGAFDFETSLGGGGADQFDDGKAICEWPAGAKS